MLEQAIARVNEDNQLKPYYDILIDYDWGNYDEHIEWVVTATCDEILEWCNNIVYQDLFYTLH